MSDGGTGKLLRSVPYFLFYVFYWTADALFVPYLGLYFELRGMDSVQIGLLNSLFYLVTVVSAVSVGYWADRTGRPRRTVTLCFSAVIFVILYMSRAVSMLHLGLAYALYGYCTVACCDLVDKLLLEHLGEDTRMYGIFRVGSPLGYSGGVILAGLLIPRFGFAAQFPVCMAFAGLCVAMALLMRESAGARRAPLCRCAGCSRGANRLISTARWRCGAFPRAGRCRIRRSICRIWASRRSTPPRSLRRRCSARRSPLR